MSESTEDNEEQRLNEFIRKRTIISFIFFGVAVVSIIVIWIGLNGQNLDRGALKTLRTVLDANEKVNSFFYSSKHLAPEYPKSFANRDVRVNGDIGMGSNFEPEDWSLTVHRHPENKNADSVFQLGMKDIFLLPKKNIIFDFKCIEGWNQVTGWGGARFIDFITKYNLGTKSGKTPDLNHPEDLYKYVGLITPDSAYYVGIDMKSMLQEQTLLCYELNDEPLPIDQGAPLRLIITVKYGVKSIKRIGTIYFSDERPKDYWYERGYDYDAAL